MLTPDGARRVWQELADALTGGWIVVSDGTQEADAEITSVVQEAGDGVARLVLRATFGEGVGNFEWRSRGVKLADGTMLDRVAEDGGRKASGVVDTEYILELASS